MTNIWDKMKGFYEKHKILRSGKKSMDYVWNIKESTLSSVAIVLLDTYLKRH